MSNKILDFIFEHFVPIFLVAIGIIWIIISTFLLVRFIL